MYLFLDFAGESNKLGTDLKALVDDSSLSDVSFLLDDGEVIYAHKAILVARSSYFKGLLDGAGVLGQTANEKVNMKIEQVMSITMFQYAEHWKIC